jgi:hypothetical protein
MVPLALTPERQGGYLVRYEAAPKKPEMGELGGSGTTAYSGWLQEEYLSELRHPASTEVYDRMRRSDPQVRMTLRAINYPLMQAKWQVKPSEDDPDKGEQIAEFVKRLLFQHMEMTWSDTLRHALLMLPFGFSPMEPVWQSIDRQDTLKGTGAPEKITALQKLAPRLPKSLWTWDGLDTGKLTGITQRLTLGGFRTVSIPIERLVLFVLDQEGDNYEGVSLLRSAYKPWFLKEHTEKIIAAGIERFAMGVPVGSIEGGTGFDPDSDKGKQTLDQLEDILSNIQANERAYFVEVPGVKFRFEVQKIDVQNPLEFVEYCSRQIALNVMLQFMELGNTQSGSKAVATEQRGPFDLQLLGIAEEISQTLNHGPIEALVRYNFGQRPGYPEIQATGITESDQLPLAKVLQALITAGAIVPDDDLEDYLRDVLDLPGRDTKSARVPAVKPSPAPVTLGHDDGCTHTYQESGRPFWRDPTPAERFTAFSQIKYDLDQAKTDFLSRVGETAAEIARALAEDAARLVATGDLDRLLALKPAKLDKLQSKIKGELALLVAYGRQTVKDEHDRARAGESASTIVKERQAGDRGYLRWAQLTTAAVAAFQAIKSRRQAEAIAAALDAAVTDEGLRLIRTGADEASATAVLTDAATKASDRSVIYAAGVLISEAFALGRGEETRAEAEAGGIVDATYSALLDDVVCDACRARDGEVYLPTDSEFEDFAAGNSGECAGADRCRCVLVYRFADEAAPAVIDWLPGDNPDVVMPGYDPFDSAG